MTYRPDPKLYRLPSDIAVTEPRRKTPAPSKPVEYRFTDWASI